MSRLLILGSNSTAGSYAAYYFSREGYDVIATSRSKQGPTSQLPYLFKNCPPVSYCIYNLNSSVAVQSALLNEISPDYILNFASQSMVGQSWDKPCDWMQTNCVGQTALLEALRQLVSLKRYIHFSTPEVYGSTDGWIKESHQYNPSTPYASSRALGDINARLWSMTYQIPTTITRAANLYCEGQHLYRIIPRTILAALDPNPLTIDGDGSSVRSFIHMEDVCRFIDLSLSSGDMCNDYHISTKSSISILGLVQLIFDKLGVSTSDPRHLAYGPDRRGKDQYYLLDPSKAYRDFKWQPTISLDQGIDAVIRWFSSHSVLDLPKSYVHKQ
jgi:dTDP-glucose 4,6-dehydratase